MQVLSHGVVARTFGPPVACCCCLLSRLELGPSWVLVLRNALETTVEERLLALEMRIHSQDDRPETRLKNGLFSPQNGPPRGTTAWYMPYCTRICHHLIAQSLWKNNGPHWKHLHGTPTIVLNFHDDRPENSPKTAIFWTLTWP